MTHPTRIVFAGAGHASLLALKALGRLEADVTLLSDGPFAYYSGMVPGWIEGLYEEREMRIPLAPFAARVGARFVDARMTGATAETVVVEGGGRIPYDILVLNIGAETRPVAGGAAAVVPGKPFRRLAAALRGRLDSAAAFAVIGAGAAGAEVALALRRRRPEAPIALVEQGETILAPFPDAFRRRVERHLRQADIAVHTGAEVAAVDAGGLELASGTGAGKRIAADLTLAFTGPVPPSALDETPFARAPDGFLATDGAVRVLSQPNVLAAGDVATSVASPRPKAGVFAVRSGKPLASAVRALMEGREPPPLRLQRRALVLLSTGGRRAIGHRDGIVLEGRAVWLWKDRLDRNFIAKLAGNPHP